MLRILGIYVRSAFTYVGSERVGAAKDIERGMSGTAVGNGNG